MRARPFLLLAATLAFTGCPGSNNPLIGTWVSTNGCPTLIFTSKTSSSQTADGVASPAVPVRYEVLDKYVHVYPPNGYTWEYDVTAANPNSMMTVTGGGVVCQYNRSK